MDVILRLLVKKYSYEELPDKKINKLCEYKRFFYFDKYNYWFQEVLVGAAVHHLVWGRLELHTPLKDLKKIIGH